MKIDNSKHTQHPWGLDALLPDFEIEDVWQFPVQLEAHHNIHEFRSQFKEVMDKITNNGLAAALFKIRFFIGGILGWDETLERSTFVPGSIRERFAKREGLSFAQMPAPGTEEFVPVYEREEEFLAEIENATVHAAMHLGKVPAGDKYTVQMAVYVKPKGVLGRCYMQIIKPFRLAIVYPAMMRSVGKQWKKYLQQEKTIAKA